MCPLLRLIAAVSLFLLPLGHVADTARAADKATAGQVVVPTARMPLRSAPPSFLGGKGEQIGETRPQETYRVLETRHIPTILGREQWLRVAPEDGPPSTGWIYTGREGDASNIMVAPSKKEK